MTTEHLAMLATGQIIAAGMFALGVLVGSSLSRKESTHDNGNEGTKDKGRWHQPVGGNAQGSIERRIGSSADSRQ
jgi:acyl dehydratase